MIAFLMWGTAALVGIGMLAIVLSTVQHLRYVRGLYRMRKDVRDV